MGIGFFPMEKQHKRIQFTRKKKKEAKKRQKKSIDIAEPELLSKEQLKKIVSNPKACATSVSGKRRRKMLKRLRHQQKDKNKMEVEEAAPAKKVPKDSAPKPSSSTEMADQHDSDVEMDESEDD